MNTKLHAIFFSGTRFLVLGALIFMGFQVDWFPSIYVTVASIVVIALILDWLITQFFKVALQARCGNCQAAFNMYLGKREYNNGSKMREVKYRCHKCDMRIESGIFVY